MSVVIHKVTSKQDTKAFIDFPHSLYAGDPHYVPELYLNISEVLSPKKNPFFKHSQAVLLLAKVGTKVIGRIACIRDNNYNEFHKSNVGFFGFFDVVEDYDVAKLLLDEACKYAKAQGFDRILGPTNFTTNDTAGMLVEGFDRPPTVMMTYNKPYYVDFVERYGLAKEMDMYAYYIPTDTANEKSLRLAGMLRKRLESKGIVIRNLDMKRYKAELSSVKDIYRQAWENNWGFVPPTDAEFDHLAEGLKLLVDSRYVFMAEKEGKVIGFGAAIPDINEITKDFKRGRLLPFNVFKLLLKKSKTKKIRIILLGVVGEYRKLGIEGVMFANYIQAARDYGLKGGEASWILESNEMMVKGAENLNGQRTQTYRIYGMDVS